MAYSQDRQQLQRPHRILVVGGGCSGIILTIQLLLRSTLPLCITVVDRGLLPGRGVAYATSRTEHILNVKALAMSALHDDPQHFVRWLASADASIRPGDFVPRQLYGEYLGDLYKEACKSSHNSSITWLTGHAISLQLEDGVARLTLAGGDTHDADIVVLATGNAPPALPQQLAHLDENFVASYAWAHGALDNIPEHGSVLVLGSGLTAVDQVLALSAQGFLGKITLLSRHGKLPALHGKTPGSWPADWTRNLPGDLQSITASIRRQIDLAQRQGADWRAVLDSMRPCTASIWQSLSPKDKKRFLRHLRSYWEIARHRIPWQTHASLEALAQCGRLSIVAGTLLTAEECAHQVAVCYRQRGQHNPSTLTVDRIINCIGPGFTPRSQDTLIEQLVRDQLARLHSAGLGIDTAPDGALISASGVPNRTIYTIGPVRKATLWETTAVPEIREQAVRLADLLLEQMRKTSKNPALASNQI